LPVCFPEATHGPSRIPYVTVRQAIGELPRLQNGASKDYLPYRKRNLTEYQKRMRPFDDGGAFVQGNLVRDTSTFALAKTGRLSHRDCLITTGTARVAIQEFTTA
jgi:ribosomal protein S30